MRGFNRVLAVDPDAGTVEVEGLTTAFDETTLFENLSFTIHKRDRIAVTGPNAATTSGIAFGAIEAMDGAGGGVSPGGGGNGGLGFRRASVAMFSRLA